MIEYDRAYYEKLMRENNYDPLYFGWIDFGLGSMLSRSVKRRWLCHHGADLFSEYQFHNPGKSIITTGIGLSGAPHIGTLSQILKTILLQKAGLKVQFVLGDLDAYNGKMQSLDSVKKLSQRYKKFILALGFDNATGILRNQYDSLKVLRTSYLLGKYMSDEMFDKSEEDLHSFYEERGKVDSNMSYRRKLSLALMTADFFDLIINGYSNILVMLGVDEHQYVRFAKEVEKNIVLSGELKNYYPYNISGIYSSMIRGFNGYPKMSKSFPNSSINLENEIELIEKRIMLEEGDYSSPENSVVYQMMEVASDFSDNTLDDAYLECKNKSSQWQLFKKKYLDLIISYKRKWEETNNDTVE